MDRAEALVREMEVQGIDAPIDIYHTMMDGYTMIGNEEKCLIVFDRLKVLLVHSFIIIITITIVFLVSSFGMLCAHCVVINFIF